MEAGPAYFFENTGRLPSDDEDDAAPGQLHLGDYVPGVGFVERRLTDEERIRRNCGESDGRSALKVSDSSLIDGVELNAHLRGGVPLRVSSPYPPTPFEAELSSEEDTRLRSPTGSPPDPFWEHPGAYSDVRLRAAAGMADVAAYLSPPRVHTSREWGGAARSWAEAGSGGGDPSTNIGRDGIVEHACRSSVSPPFPGPGRRAATDLCAPGDGSALDMMLRRLNTSFERIAQTAIDVAVMAAVNHAGEEKGTQ